MPYMLIDPPVSPLSPPAKIQTWLEELAARVIDPQYSDPTIQRQIQSAIVEAREWLDEARAISPPPPPALARPMVDDQA